MTFLNVILLALVQGLAEFLPISSSGHLVLVQALLGLHDFAVFDVLLHFGSLCAILIYFRRQLITLLAGLLRQDKQSLALLRLLGVATIPAILVGLFLQSQLDLLFSSPKLVGLALVWTAILLFATRFFPAKKTKHLSDLEIISHQIRMGRIWSC